MAAAPLFEPPSEATAAELQGRDNRFLLTFTIDGRPIGTVREPQALNQHLLEDAVVRQGAKYQTDMEIPEDLAAFVVQNELEQHYTTTRDRIAGPGAVARWTLSPKRTP